MNRPSTAHRTSTHSANNAMVLDNLLNEQLEYFAKLGAEIVDVQFTTVQAGTLITYCAMIHAIVAV